MNANLSELTVSQLYAVLFGAEALDKPDYALIGTAFDALVNAGVPPKTIATKQAEHLSALRAAKIAERLRMFGLEAVETTYDAQNDVLGRGDASC